jgi:hypothetical protein
MNFERFIKLMMMTTSSHDNEALSALRMANAELASLNRNWEEILRGKVKVETPSKSAPTGKKFDGPDINPMFERAFNRCKPNSSFYEFLESIHAWWETKGFLTEAQYNALKRSS